MDGAFFSETIISALDELGVQYTISIPVERYTSIKCYIEQRKRWRSMRANDSYCEKISRSNPGRFNVIDSSLYVSTATYKDKEPLQLDLFQPYDFDYQYKAIVTNKTTGATNTIEYYEGRGTQEGIFAELKSQLVLGYVPCNSCNCCCLY